MSWLNPYDKEENAPECSILMKDREGTLWTTEHMLSYSIGMVHENRTTYFGPGGTVEKAEGEPLRYDDVVFLLTDPNGAATQTDLDVYFPEEA